MNWARRVDNKLHNDLIIRDYHDQDFDDVVKLWNLTGMDSPVRGDTNDVIKRTIKMGGKFLVMESKSARQICGTSWLTWDGRRILLHHFGILPEYQGKGLSKILLKESLQFVKTIGSQVKLEVHSANFKALNLYEKFGFKQLEDFNVYIIRDVSNL